MREDQALNTFCLVSVKVDAVREGAFTFIIKIMEISSVFWFLSDG